MLTGDTVRFIAVIPAVRISVTLAQSRDAAAVVTQELIRPAGERSCGRHRNERTVSRTHRVLRKHHTQVTHCSCARLICLRSRRLRRISSCRGCTRRWRRGTRDRGRPAAAADPFRPGSSAATHQSCLCSRRRRRRPRAAARTQSYCIGRLRGHRWVRDKSPRRCHHHSRSQSHTQTTAIRTDRCGSGTPRLCSSSALKQEQKRHEHS